MRLIRFRNLVRGRQVLTILTRHGLGYLTERLLAEPALRALLRRTNQVPPANIAAEQLVSAMEELGPTYIKLGQFLSLRPDILPPVFIDAFGKLYERVRPFPVKEVEEIIREELGRPAGEIFAEFSEKPLAAASLAQVHAARLKDGREVVLKVQRPKIERSIQADMAILSELAQLIQNRIPEIRIFKPSELVAEFAHQLTREMDFQLEAMRIERFRKHFADDPDLYIPEVFWDYTTTKILTLERVTGPGPYRKQLQAAAISPEETAGRLFHSFLREVLEFGTFHADPHPGNICLCGGRICLVDFGIVGILTEPDREILYDIVASFASEDMDTLIAAFYRFRLISPEINERFFRREMADLFERYRGLPAGRIRMGQFLIDAIRVGRRFEISFPADLALLGKALLMVESLAASLDPKFEPLTAARPLLEEIRKEQFSPEHLLSQLIRKARLANQNLAEIPGLVFSTLRKAESGNFKIQFIHQGLEGTTQDLENSINRLAWSIMIAAVIISIALVFVKYVH